MATNVETIDILQNYQGKNPYLLNLKNQVIQKRNTSLLSDFNQEYIVTNYKTEPYQINKTIKIADWYGESLQKKYEIDFTPTKIFIKAYLGETKDYYHVYIKWRQSMDFLSIFVPKKGVLNNFLIGDYHNYQVDFTRYNNLMHIKDPNRNLRPHQEEAVQFLLDRKRCILADDMGLGKSASLSVASIEGNFDSVLIVCPASLKTNWKTELEWFVPSKDISIIDGFNGKTKTELEELLGYGIGKSGKNASELLEEAKERGKWQSNRFVIINFDILNEFYVPTRVTSESALRAHAEKYPLFEYLYNKKSLIIIDEAHNLSNNTSDRFKLLKNLIAKSKPNSLYLSTGTPITNHPDNYFNLLTLIGDPIADDWEYYMKRYCDARKFPAKGEREKWTNIYLKRVHKPDWYSLSQEQKDELKEFISKYARKITVAKGESNLDELKERTAHIYLRRVKEDLKSLPKKNIHEMFYDFDMQQMFEYNKLWDEYEREKKELDPEKELNKELLEGAIYRKYCSDQMVPYTERMTDEFISNGNKVVIMCCYDDELYTLKEYYGDKCVIYNGKMSIKEKDKAKDNFITDPNTMVFIGNIKAAGVGLTLTVANKMIFNNISFVPGDNQQAMDRIYRIGQTKDVDVYYQMFRGTQYEKMWNTVLRKQLTIDQVIKKEDEK